MKLQTKILVTLNMLLVVLLVWIISRENYPLRVYKALTKPKVNIQKTSYLFNRDELFRELNKDTTDIIFLGDSHTQNYELAEYFKNLHLKNRGITGDDTFGVLHRLKTIIDGKPKKLFLEIGINDLFMQVNEDSLLKNYFKIIESVLVESPKTKIYVQTLFPILNNNEILVGHNTTHINKQIININLSLKLFCASKNLILIDTYTKFNLDSQLNKQYTIDGLHLNAKGYKLWTEILAPYINEK